MIEVFVILCFLYNRYLLFGDFLRLVSALGLPSQFSKIPILVLIGICRCLRIGLLGLPSRAGWRNVDSQRDER